MKIEPITEDVYHVSDTDKEDAYVEGRVCARHADATATPMDEIEATVVSSLDAHGGVRTVRVDAAHSAVETEVFVATRAYGTSSAHYHSAHTRLCEAVRDLTETCTVPPSDDIQEWTHRQPNQYKHERWWFGIGITNPVNDTDHSINYKIHRFDP